MTNPAERPLSESLIGTWELLSRHTRRGDDGAVTPLADDVLALAVYDAGGNFAGQFMKHNRASEPDPVVAPTGANNSRTIGGYDAYFGRYVVDDRAGTVTQTLRGSLAPENVGQVLTRAMSVHADVLTIRVDTTDNDGQALVLTLLWQRVG